MRGQSWILTQRLSSRASRELRTRWKSGFNRSAAVSSYTSSNGKTFPALLEIESDSIPSSLTSSLAVPPSGFTTFSRNAALSSRHMGMRPVAPLSTSTMAFASPSSMSSATSPVKAHVPEVREAPEERVKKEAKGEAGKALWEKEMPRDEAASVLGKFLNYPEMKPGEVVCLTADEIHNVLLATENDKNLESALFSHANGVTERFFGNEVYYRGIVEFSNVCTSDCGYCGIRKHQPGIHRYTMDKEDVVETAVWAHKHKYGSIMLQSGELNTESRMQYLEEIIREIKAKTIAMDEEEAREKKRWEEEAAQGRVREERSTEDSYEATVSAVAEVLHSPSSASPSPPQSGPRASSPAEARKRGVVRQGGGTGEVGSMKAQELMYGKPKGLCVALSVGELPYEKYKRLFDAGSTRYLLRIESSNPELFASLHPTQQTWEGRYQCLKDLKEIGFQVGTGIMIGLPGQTLMDLAKDIVFFRDIGANMIGMGPYITEEHTPVAQMWKDFFGDAVVTNKEAHMNKMFELTTRVIALTRVTLGNANVTATTALQAINPVGREIALRRGANVLMPILTPTKFREDYQLYEGKPCITDTADECRKCLGVRVSMVGKRINLGVWADPPNFLHPIIRPTTPVGTRAFHSMQIFSNVSTPRGLAQYTSFSPRVGGWGSVARNFSAGSTPGGKIAAGGKGGGAEALPRVNVGMFGSMNAGKSTLINCITMQQTSIVDSTPGTTADTKIALMELHDVGPVKLFDTAGINEMGELGLKKRQKALNVLKECDVAILVIDPLREGGKGVSKGEGNSVSSSLDLSWERQVVELAEKREKDLVIVFNLNEIEMTALGLADFHVSELTDSICRLLKRPAGSASLSLNLTSSEARQKVTDFLEERIRIKQGRALPSIPPKYLSRDSMVFLNIPMDLETPGGRFLRPQSMVQEEVLRAFGTTIAYRMDLDRARGRDEGAKREERERFEDAMRALISHEGPKLMVTDSQAMDIVHPWTVDESGKSRVDLTTFSIAMVQRQSDGQLPLFVQGLSAYDKLKSGDKVLVAEACNHNRITELCNDIATVQIPNKLAEQNPSGGVIIDHAFGREFPDFDGTRGSRSLAEYSLAIHCGGCMVDRQKILARIEDLKEAKVPVTNFGLLLSYAAAPSALWRVVEPYGLSKSA